MRLALEERVVRDALALAPVTLIVAGKAAEGMVAGLLSSVSIEIRGGVAVGPTSRAVMPNGVSWHQGGHPLPDKGSVEAGSAALKCVAEAPESGVVLVLLSGGASALLALPVEGLGLEDKIATTRTLLDAGVPIHELNCVRKHLSDVKGGRLALVGRSRVLTLAISDVVGPVEDDPAVIGSGPTVPDETTYEEAFAIVGRSAIRRRIPANVLNLLERGTAGELPETLKSVDERASSLTYRMIGNRRQALDGAIAAARGLGYEVASLEAPITGEARIVGGKLVDRMIALVPGGGRSVCLVSTGETTVTVVGEGLGGRNQELALAAAPRLECGATPAVLVSVGTDGVDGPTDAAGAIVDSTTLERARAASLGLPSEYLSDNNAYRFFESLGDLVKIGPSGTNVGDLQILLTADPAGLKRRD